jgi:hypothetical protein
MIAQALTSYLSALDTLRPTLLRMNVAHGEALQSLQQQAVLCVEWLDPKASGLGNEGTDTALQAFLMHKLSSLHAMRYDAGTKRCTSGASRRLRCLKPRFTRQ